MLNPRLTRGVGASGALLAALAVALSAYAAHAAQADVRANLQIAAIFAFGHGVALAALARNAIGSLALSALLVLLAGTVLFSGALVAKYLFAVTLGVAPYGGTALILGWLLFGLATLRGQA